MAGECGVRKFNVCRMQFITCLFVYLNCSIIMPVIKFSDIVEYTEAGTRCLKEGEAVFDAEHIIMCGFNENGEIVALCLQTSILKGIPHSIKIILGDATVPTQWECTCSCKAGAGGKCKHIVATLIFSYKNDLDQLSCTDLEQAWGKKKIDSQRFVEVKPMKDFCHVKSSKPVAIDPINEPLLNEAIEQIIRAAPNSDAAICPVRKRKSLPVPPAIDLEVKTEDIIREALKSTFNSDLKINFPPSISIAVEEQNYYVENIKISQIEAENICIQTIGQNSQLWEDLRRSRITGSKCYDLYTYCKNKNPDWDNKVTSSLEYKFKGNKATKHGTIHEPHARAAYVSQYGEILETGIVINTPKVAMAGM